MALTARINERYLPWLNVVQGDLTLSRLARLSLFQVSVGICFVLLNGTLTRIMVVEPVSYTHLTLPTPPYV